MDEATRKQIARTHLDAAEAWLRRLVELKLKQQFGETYLQPDPSGCSIIGDGLRKRIMSRFDTNRGRFARQIDASDFDDLIKIILLDKLYWPYFCDALDEAYSGSRESARAYMRRLRDLRNTLAHGGVCSTRDYEKSVCYSNDLIDSIMSHLKDVGMERTFSVPTFIRVTDNFGNDFHLSPASGMQSINVVDRGKGELEVGQVLTIEVEVDPSFTDYKIEWMTFNGDMGVYPLSLSIAAKHVGIQMDVRLQMKSNKDWHRLHGGWDDILDLRYRVLPPFK